MLNKLLKRQLQKHFGEEGEVPENYIPVLKVISESYEHYEKDRKMLERSIELTSYEMIELNDRLRKEKDELKEAHNELNKIFNNIDEVLYSVDMVSYKLIKMSAVCEKIYGYTPEEFYADGNLWQAVIHPEDKHIEEQHVQLLYQGKQVLNQYRIIHKNGSIRWIDNKVIPTLNQDGQLIRLDGVTSDITEKKSADELLRKSKINLAAIIENNDAHVYSLDRDFRYITFNNLIKNTMKEIYNLDIKPGDKVFDFLKDIDPLHAKFWEETYSDGLTGKVIQFIKDYSTETIRNYVSFSITPIWENKNVIGLSCFARDITKQKLAEDALQKSEERYRQIVETADEGIWTIDEANITTFANKKMLEILGYNINEMIGKKFFDFMADNWKIIAEEKIKAHMNGIIKNLELKLQTKNGKEVWINLSITSITDHNKKYKGILAMVTDITERKKTHEKLVKSEIEIRNFAKHINYVLEEERSHIAREIHDELGQQLVGIKMGLSSFKKQNGSNIKTEKKVTGMMEDVDNTIQSLRKIATALRPGILDTLGLIPSIEWLIKEFKKRTSTNYTIELNVNKQKFEKNISTCFFRICQEALTNISKHADASEVIIHVSEYTNELVLKIEDNGKGILSEKLENPFSVGLVGMRERANIIGANLRITSKKGLGTAVVLIAKIN